MDVWMVALAVAISIVAVATPLPGNLLTTGHWMFKCFFFLLTTSDTKKPKTLPAPLKITRDKRVRVIFIRHGESIWNALFNRFGLGWPYRAVRYTLETALMVLGNRNDSVIIDSPLSPLGERQASELARYIQSPTGRAAMPFDPQVSVVVCSNLRRCMATAAIGLDLRLRTNPGERIIIDSSLQEGSRNADAQSFMSTKCRLADSPVLSYQTAAELGAVFDPSLSLGNKPRKGNVFRRIDGFAARCFGEGPDGLPAFPGAPATVIVCGHSLWFRKFFNRFLPAESKHIAKVKKMKNCSVVAFDFVADEKGRMTVDEPTIQPLHLGFVK